MKYIVYVLFFSTFLNIYSSQDSNLSGLPTLNENRAFSSCWFKNKSMAYPFEDIDMQKFFGEFNFKSKFTFLNRIYIPIIFFLTIEILVFQPLCLSWSPLFAGNMLNGIIYMNYSCRTLESITKSLTPEDYHLSNQVLIKKYLHHIKNGDNPICKCTNQINKVENFITLSEPFLRIDTPDVIYNVDGSSGVVPRSLALRCEEFNISLPIEIVEKISAKLFSEKHVFFVV